MTPDPVRDALLVLAEHSADLDPADTATIAAGILRRHVDTDQLAELADTVNKLLDLEADPSAALTYLDDGWAGPGAADYARRILEQQRDDTLTQLRRGDHG